MGLPSSPARTTLPPMKRERLDFRYQSECPACGNAAGWTGNVTRDGGRVWVEMSCPVCNNLFDELNPAWEKDFEAGEPPFRAGA